LDPEEEWVQAKHLTIFAKRKAAEATEVVEVAFRACQAWRVLAVASTTTALLEEIDLLRNLLEQLIILTWSKISTQLAVVSAVAWEEWAQLLLVLMAWTTSLIVKANKAVLDHLAVTAMLT
jgi:hypothetical protein